MLGIHHKNQPECLLSGVRHVALDLDGTLYKGATLFRETVPFLETLRRLKIGYSFLTNNPSRSRHDYLKHFAGLGIPAVLEEVNTPVQATIRYLRESLPSVVKLSFLGTLSMIEEFRRFGYVPVEEEEEAEAVVVAFAPTMQYDDLCRVAWWISQGKPYIATNPDRVCPTDRSTVLPDCGALCAALEAATGRSPDVVIGKPNPLLLRDLLRRYELRPKELVMVGDRLYTDIEMARRAGSLSVLVLSGEAKAEEAGGAEPTPDFVLDHIGVLGELLEAAHNGRPEPSMPL